MMRIFDSLYFNIICFWGVKLMQKSDLHNMLFSGHLSFGVKIIVEERFNHSFRRILGVLCKIFQNKFELNLFFN